MNREQRQQLKSHAVFVLVFAFGFVFVFVFACWLISTVLSMFPIIGFWLPNWKENTWFVKWAVFSLYLHVFVDIRFHWMPSIFFNHSNRNALSIHFRKHQIHEKKRFKIAMHNHRLANQRFEHFSVGLTTARIFRHHFRSLNTFSLSFITYSFLFHFIISIKWPNKSHHIPSLEFDIDNFSYIHHLLCYSITKSLVFIPFFRHFKLTKCHEINCVQAQYL